MDNEKNAEIFRQHAIRAHEQQWHSIQTTFDATIQHGLEALRTAALINGGAVIAIFAFLGATYATEDAETVRDALMRPAHLFIFGAIFCGLASGCAYFAQGLFTASASSVEYAWDHPYIRSTEASDRSERWGRFWQALSVAFVLASYIALVTGAVTAMWKIS
jgi:hypothetical protein